MAPKKDPKKEEPPKEEEPVQPHPHELQGFGKFQYLDGTVYEGCWKIFSGNKMKHGQGIIKIPGISHENIGVQTYEGSWCEDKMEGYGVYKYSNGAIYRGEWKDNKQDGKGQYEFGNGAYYYGEWRNHLMNGYGYFLDGKGGKWEGEFREGKYESKEQKELVKEKQIENKKKQAIKKIEEVIDCMIEILEVENSTDKILPYFPMQTHSLPDLLVGPYTSYSTFLPEQWKTILQKLKTGQKVPLGDKSSASVINGERILKNQLEGAGQVVEVREEKAKGVFVNVEGEIWVLCRVAYSEEN